MAENIFGRTLKAHRKKLGLTLREFCLKNDIDPGNYSRLERGRASPPQGQQLLEKYAVALEIQRDTDAWIEFFDAAAAARGEFPKDLLSDEELIDKLPALFRTLRGHPFPSEKLDELLEMIRRS
ncbi:MAG: helix-turn-helix transcriptional regulator [Planctomycetes bacterium]|nr:helix-turn-helix transcriptional regulator [Planctomycetota bacterium]